MTVCRTCIRKVQVGDFPYLGVTSGYTQTEEVMNEDVLQTSYKLAFYIWISEATDETCWF